jgi:hypothetical protein
MGFTSGWPGGTAPFSYERNAPPTEVMAKSGAKEYSPDVIDSDNLKTTRQPRNFTGIWAVLLLGATAVAWAGASTPARAAGTPQAAIGATAFDFGKIYEDRALTHTFVIKNTGAAPLYIEDVDPDCACTVPSYDKSIPPGGQGEITLTIKPFSVMHQFKKETKVRLNDPDRPMVYLTLTGVAQPFIEIQPSHIVRLRGSPGDDIRGEVRFISHLPTPLKITGFRSTIPDKIEVTLKPEVPDRVYVLEVRNQSRQAGPYAGLIELFTNAEKRPRLIVRVFGDLYLSSAVGQ